MLSSVASGWSCGATIYHHCVGVATFEALNATLLSCHVIEYQKQSWNTTHGVT
jgi:hypothetical protein